MTLAATVAYKNFIDKQEDFELLIYDTDDVLSSDYALNATLPGASVRWSGSENEVYSPIVPAELRISVYIENSDHEILLNAIIESLDHRFLLELRRRNKGGTWTTEFKGLLINNYGPIEYDSVPYIMEINGYDGLKDLSNTEYDRTQSWYDGTNFRMTTHMGNCLDAIPNLDLLYGTSEPKFEFLTEWVNSDFNYTSFPTTWQFTDYDPTRFYEVNADGSFKFWSCWDVLKAFCERYAFRLRQVGGVFRFEQLPALISSNVIDRFKKDASYLDQTTSRTIIDVVDPATTYNFAAVPDYHIVPPVKWISVTVKDSPELNLAYDKVWTESLSVLEDLGDMVDNEATHLRIKIYIDFETDTLGSSAYVKHFYKWKVTIKVGADYLTLPVVFKNVTGGKYEVDPSWTVGSSDYVYMIGWAEPKTDPVFNNWDGKSYIEINIKTPMILSSSALEVQVERDSYLDGVGAAISEPLGSPWSGFAFTWTAKMDIRLYNGDKEIKDLIFTGINNVENHEILEYETTFIDTSTNWKESTGASTTMRIEELFIQEMIKVFYNPFKMIQGELTSDKAGDPIYPEKIYFANFLYAFIQGTWETGLNTIQGDWFVSDPAKKSGSPTIASTEENIYPGLGETVLPGIRTTALEAIAETQLSIDEPGETYPAGSTVVITDFATGQIIRTTLTNDLGATDTTLDIDDALAVALAQWSLIEITPDPDEENWIWRNQLFSPDGIGTDISTFVGGTFVDVTVGTIPSPIGVGGTQFRRRVRVFLRGVKQDYKAIPDMNHHFKVDVSGGNNRVHVRRTIAANDRIEVEILS